MEKTQGLENSVSLTTNTHSSIWPVGPLIQAFFLHIYGYKQTYAYECTNKPTPCKRKEHKHLLRAWQSFLLLALKIKCRHICYFRVCAHSCWNVHPHGSTTAHFQTRMMKVLLFMNLSALKKRVFVFLTFLSPTQALSCQWGIVKTGKILTIFFSTYFSPALHTVMGPWQYNTDPINWQK